MIKGIKKYFKENKVVRNGVIVTVAACVIFLMGLAISEKMNAGVNELQIKIEYKDQTKKLINKAYVRKTLKEELGFDVERVKLKDLDLMKIEAFLQRSKYVKEVEVFIDSRKNVVVEMEQKNPIVRINRNDRSFYLDEEGVLLPLSRIAAVRVPVITGDVEAYEKEYWLKKSHQYQDIYRLISTIRKDDLLTSLIEQIHIENDGEYLLIPKIGKEKIILGSVDDLEDKLFNLKEFYKEGLTREGWGKYAYLDLRNEGLVYATRK